MSLSALSSYHLRGDNRMEKRWNVEVITILLHAVISLCILVGYIYTVAIGKPDETLKTLLIMIGGFWFGVLGKNSVAQGFGRKTDKSKDKEGGDI